MGPNQERMYRLALEAAGLLEGEPEDLPELELLKAAVLEHEPPKPHPKQTSSVAKWREKIKKMMDRGARPTAIYDKLRLEDKEFKGSLWAVKRLCRRLMRQRKPSAADVVIPVITAAGEVAQVDFGYVGKLFDPTTGRERKAWVFLMVLGHSRHMFARVVFDQKTETWLELHERAFEWFGGRVETVVPDNLKAAVVRAAFGINEDVALNRSYRELAKHYGFKIDPAPPYQANKKGKVESGVKYVKNNFFKPRQFEDLEDANRRLEKWVLEIAGKRIHGTTVKKPLDVFEQEEKSALKPLPAKRFKPVVWKQVKIRQDCQFIFERRAYPVPWRNAGKQAWIKASARMLTAYVDDVAVASHERGKPVPPEVMDRYLPDHRAAYRHRSRDWWQAKADRMGTEVGQYIQEVFDSDDVLSQLRQVQAMVTLLEKHPRHRACAACVRAQFYGNHKYQGLKEILLKALDQQPLPTVTAPAHGRLANPRYARTVAELLQLEFEDYHEPN
jgi:transposase